MPAAKHVTALLCQALSFQMMWKWHFLKMQMEGSNFHSSFLLFTPHIPLQGLRLCTGKGRCVKRVFFPVSKPEQTGLPSYQKVLPFSKRQYCNLAKKDLFCSILQGFTQAEMSQEGVRCVPPHTPAAMCMVGVQCSLMW